MQVIKKLEFAHFKVWWEEKPDEVMELDFNPLLDKFGLRKSDNSLLHWQGVPLGHRQWGCYDCLIDEYFSLGHEQLHISKASTLLQIPDNSIKQGKRPSAVILYGGSLWLSVEKALLKVAVVDS